MSRNLLGSKSSRIIRSQSLELIWRLVKQRLKSQGLITDSMYLRRATEEEWDKIIKVINKAIADMLERVAVLREHNGCSIPF